MRSCSHRRKQGEFQLGASANCLYVRASTFTWEVRLDQAASRLELDGIDPGRGVVAGMSITCVPRHVSKMSGLRMIRIAVNTIGLPW